MSIVSFEQESKAVANLFTVLEQEQQCLIDADIEKIQALVDEKSKIIQSLNTLSKKRYEALAKAGFNSNELGMAEWVNAQKQPKLQAAWLSTQQTLAKAKELNRVNGLLINKHYNRNQQKLKTLQGSSAEHLHFYGPNGHTTSQVRLGGAIVS